jgi:hypothetical protein
MKNNRVDWGGRPASQFDLRTVVRVYGFYYHSQMCPFP